MQAKVVTADDFLMTDRSDTKSAANRAEVVNMHLHGLTNPEIEARTDYKIDSIEDILHLARRYGILLRVGLEQISYDEKQEIVDKYRQGAEIKAIAESLNCDESVIHQALSNARTIGLLELEEAVTITNLPTTDDMPTLSRMVMEMYELDYWNVFNLAAYFKISVELVRNIIKDDNGEFAKKHKPWLQEMTDEELEQIINEGDTENDNETDNEA
jgi:transposase-like protein